ncbi:MAG: proA [Verrucomicrobiales bacterium]|nr:proA [Verrucomicrobiales bacterium]
MSLRERIHQLGRQALEASRALAVLPTETKNRILSAMADALEARAEIILAANARDLEAGREKGLSAAMLDRLMLDSKRLAAMASGVREVVDLPDPVGYELDAWERPNGLHMRKVRVPIGVIGIIYESRPNVTSDAAVLCFKSGNATILRGGSEAFHSNTAIAEALQAGGEAAGLPPHSIQLVPFTDRESVQHLAEMNEYLDLIIPRGGKGLIETVVRLARMPVIKHYDGICHVYVDAAADFDMALNILLDAKTKKPSACNAAETLLVHEAVAVDFYRKAVPVLLAAGVKLYGDAVLTGLFPDTTFSATEDNYRTEYLDLGLSVKTVSGLDEAIAHIRKFGSRHSEVIVTADAAAAARFLNEIDSAVLLWNASTRFNDGGEFGFGCEIGISTDKLHARGPMGLPELTSYKYLVVGNGQVRG